MKDNKQYVFTDNVRNPEMVTIWEQIKADKVDPFAMENLAKYHPKPILLESAHWIVTENAHPYLGAKHHLLFITKQFYEQKFSTIPAEVKNDLYVLADKIIEKLGITGGSLWTRFGDHKKSGSSVLHFHAQLIEPEDEYIVPAWYGVRKNPA